MRRSEALHDQPDDWYIDSDGGSAADGEALQYQGWEGRMMKFDWEMAFSGLLPVGVFCVILFIFYLYAGLLIWIEDRKGIPVMISLLFTALVVLFILNGLVVFP